MSHSRYGDQKAQQYSILRLWSAHKPFIVYRRSKVALLRQQNILNTQPAFLDPSANFLATFSSQRRSVSMYTPRSLTTASAEMGMPDARLMEGGRVSGDERSFRVEGAGTAKRSSCSRELLAIQGILCSCEVLNHQ